MEKINRKQIVDAIREVNSFVREWEQLPATDPSVKVVWQNQLHKGISDDLIGLFDELCQLCGRPSGEVPKTARGIVLTLDHFCWEFLTWYRASEALFDSVRPDGSVELWQAWQALLESCQDVEKRLPEPIRDLMDQDASNEIICKIYGFLHEDGSPDFVKLAEEKEKPGTHYNPKTWVPPAAIRKQREIDEVWKGRSPIHYESVVEEKEEAAKTKHIAPESIDELLAQEVPPELIAKMKAISVEEVEDYAMQHGLPVGGRYLTDPDATKIAQMRSELVPKSYPEIADMSERILACAKDKMNVKEIAIALQPTFPDLTWKMVAAEVKKAKDLQAAS